MPYAITGVRYNLVQAPSCQPRPPPGKRPGVSEGRQLVCGGHEVAVQRRHGAALLPLVRRSCCRHHRRHAVVIGQEAAMAAVGADDRAASCFWQTRAGGPIARGWRAAEEVGGGVQRPQARLPQLRFNNDWVAPSAGGAQHEWRRAMPATASGRRKRCIWELDGWTCTVSYQMRTQPQWQLTLSQPTRVTYARHVAIEGRLPLLAVVCRCVADTPTSTTDRHLSCRCCTK